jgi:hypothetical protein
LTNGNELLKSFKKINLVLLAMLFCEVVWGLRGRPYQFGKDVIIATLEMMVQSSGFEARKPFSGLPSITTYQAGMS